MPSNTGSSSPIVVTGLTNGVEYTATVHATNAVGDSVESSPSAPFTPSASATVPSAPIIGAATAGVLSASVAFTPPGSDGGSAITGYTATSSPGGITGSGSASPITVSGLTAGTAYTFTVHATNAVGNSAESAASNSVTPSAASTAPGVPTIGTATAGDTTATANWTAPASDGGSAITGYTVKTYDTSGSLLATDTVGVVLTYTKTGLTNGTGVKFKVQATNAIGTGTLSSFSNTVTPAAWNPASLPNVVRWGDPQTLTAGALASYADSSAAGTTLAQATSGKQPLVVDSVLSGKKVVRFDGVDDFLVSANFGSPKTQPTTAILVVRLASEPTTTAKLIDGGGAGRNALYVDVDGTTGLRTKLFVFAGLGGSLGGGTLTSGTWAILLQEFNAASSKLYINGGTAITAMGTAGDTDPQGRITLACDSSQGAHFVPGDYADDIFIDGLLTVSEKNQLGAWLVAQYPALTWTTVTA